MFAVCIGTWDTYVGVIINFIAASSNANAAIQAALQSLCADFPSDHPNECQSCVLITPYAVQGLCSLYLKCHSENLVPFDWDSSVHSNN